jgi:hypothetical protein
MIFTALNWIALVGWSAVFALTAAAWSDGEQPSAQLLQLTLACEVICTLDVIRIALGMLRGDLALAVTVHYTRLLMWFVTLPHSATSPLVVKLILAAWSLTEIGRYPMVLFPDVAVLRTIRYATPVVTFPMGAGTEAYAAYLVLIATSDNAVLRAALGFVVLVNVVGGTVWYPSMVAKVGKSLAAKKDAKKL